MLPRCFTQSKNIFNNSIVILAIVLTTAVVIYATRSDSIKEQVLILAIFPCFIIFVSYLLYTVKNPKKTIPIIICASWLVYIEPAPCDILAGLAIIAFILNIGVYKKPIPRLSFTEILLSFYIILNINNLIYTNDISYSLRYFFISFYLLCFFILISKLSDSYDLIEKQLNLYFIPCVVSCFLLIFGYLSATLNINIGIFQDILVEQGRIKGFFKDPNVAGPFLLQPAIYSLATILNKRSKFNLLFLCLFALSVIGILTTLSRAAVLALIFGILVVFCFSMHMKKFVKIILMLIYFVPVISAFLFVAPKSNISSRMYDTQFGVGDRIERIERGLSVFAENPLIGKGMTISLAKAPHDSYFLLLMQTGFIGFACFWTPVIYLIIKLLKLYRNSMLENEKIIFLSLTASLLSHMVLGFAVFFLHWRHFWFITGLAAAAVRLNDSNTERRLDKKSRLAL